MDLTKIYDLANIPVGFRQIHRSSTYLSSEIQGIHDYVLSYIHGLPTSSQRPPGATLLGPALSGKTYWGCALMRALLHHRLYEISGNHFSPHRFDYLELMSENQDYQSQFATIHHLREAPWIFMDNLCFRAPSAALLSAMLFRRDNKKATFLAFRTANLNDLPESLLMIMQSFDQVNRKFLLPVVPMNLAEDTDVVTPVKKKSRKISQ